MLVVRCGEPERRDYLRRLTALGLPVSLVAGAETASFSFRYDSGGERRMQVEAVGEPWHAEDEPERFLRQADAVHVTPLLRGDFPSEVLERIAHRRRVLLDAHGLVRRRAVGPLSLDADFDHTLLRHVSILKLAEEEARAIVGDGDLEELRGLGVPEVVVTFGGSGSLVLARGGSLRIPAQAVHGEPTGAGDAFSVAYLEARTAGHQPASAARRATALVAALLSARRR
jgi:sugar/nucleoside kinase (ribokinase family)